MNALAASVKQWIARSVLVLKGLSAASVLGWAVPLALFWILLNLRLPYSISRPLSTYSSVLFLFVLGGYYLVFRPRSAIGILAGLALTMLLVGLSVSFLWTSAYTDNGIIGGLLPHKDAKNYYFGALQLLDGLPIRAGIHAVRRPLFSGLLATLLLLTGGNLKLVTAVLAQLAAFGLFASAHTIRNSFGPAAAALYASLMLFHIQPKLGYNLSELPGFTLGCLAFSILWIAASRRNWTLISLGLATLMTAITTRAGAFLVFPAIAVWCGWIFRGARRYSATAAVISAGGIALLYLLVNQTLSRLLNVDLTDQWGSFAYAIYGQVHGGTGWHSAIDDLQTTQASVVVTAAWQYFLADPRSLLIGVARSYRDFFLPGDLMIFPFGSVHEPPWPSYLLWAGTMLLLLRGLIGSLRGYRLARASLLLACFAGIMLSIPFLPPVDGGARFHASSVAFLFALTAAGLARAGAWLEPSPEARPLTHSGLSLAAGSAVILLMMATIAPIAIYRLTPPQTAVPPVCPADQESFVVRTQPDSYVDVLPGATNGCGVVPRICLADFDKNATDKANDDVVQAMLEAAKASPGGIRIIPAMNLLDHRFSYFISPIRGMPAAPSGQQVSGCAALIETRNSRLYQIESQSPPAAGTDQ
ncbi:MAG: hypothetical protein V1755_02045 [Chloroflexota bacterium]